MNAKYQGYSFPLRDTVQREKVRFHNRYGIELVGDLYLPKAASGKLAAIAVAGPFGAVKEQCAGLYAEELASRGFAALAFDPSFIGESGGEVRNVASPDINTEDFSAAVDFLSTREFIDPDKVGILGICGWGGMALNAAAMDTRIKATVTSTMYDMTRVNAKGYFDSADSADARYEMKKALNEVNQSLKEKGLYFNALSHKKSNSGGPYIPAANILNKETELNDKVSAIFENMEDIDYYKQVIEKTPIGKPVWSYWVTSKFGIRLDPFKKSKATHKGIDLASMSGNKIRTQAKGKVIRADANVGGYGMLIEIDHGNGFKTKYAHMQKMYVQKGDEVEANEAIGEVGSTGRSTGPHLHYEILYRGVPVDPMPFMQAKL